MLTVTMHASRQTIDDAEDAPDAVRDIAAEASDEGRPPGATDDGR